MANGFPVKTTFQAGDALGASELNALGAAINQSGAGIATAAGDLLYASAANTLARLAKGTAGQVLKMNSGATAPEWGIASTVTFDYFNNASSHTYGTETWRDMPNSSKTITLVQQSTIFCIGHIYEYLTSGKTYGFFDAKFNIDGTDIDFGLARRTYGTGSHLDSVPIFGYKTGVAAGSRTIKIREICSADGYTVEGKTYAIIIVSEE